MNMLLKHGGWIFQGSREDIVLDEVDAAGRRYQVTRYSRPVGPDYQLRFVYHRMRCAEGVVDLDTMSRSSRSALREAAAAGREALEAGVPIVVIRRRRAGFNDAGDGRLVNEARG